MPEVGARTEIWTCEDMDFPAVWVCIKHPSLKRKTTRAVGLREAQTNGSSARVWAPRWLATTGVRGANEGIS